MSHPDYLTMEVTYSPVNELFNLWQQEIPVPLKNRGEAHITVITPPEFAVLKDYMTMDEIEEIAVVSEIQKARFEIVCLGAGTVQSETTYFMVVKSPDLLKIRKRIRRHLIDRGGDTSVFSPEHFYPHITIGYINRDLHEADGVIKDEKSCIQDIKVSE